jgi:hypothetical protein
MWFKGVQNEKNKRGFKTKIINALFERDSKGRLIMKPEAPFFTSYKQTQERKSFGVEQTGLPRGVFRGMYFQNSEEALQEALDNNEIEVVTQGGRDWYSFIRLSKTHEVSKLGNQKIVTQQKKSMVMLANLWKMHGINWTGGSSQRPLQITMTRVALHDSSTSQRQASGSAAKAIHTRQLNQSNSWNT